MTRKTKIIGKISGRKIFHDIYSSLITIDNIFQAYNEFRQGKRNKADVLEFEANREENLLELFEELKIGRYRHGEYKQFIISDPKPRKISKATVRDRIVHHLIARKLEDIFEPVFIHDVYSSRKEKGTFKAIDKLKKILLDINRNNNNNQYLIIKCDIKKFFASVDRQILLKILIKKVADKNFIWLLKEIIFSFNYGIPLGNLTSQVFANIYLNQLDQFIKHKLKIKHYLRYCDDFLMIVEKGNIRLQITEIDIFLQKELHLRLHPDKIVIKKINQGIDWLGFVVLPKYSRIRNKTKNRIIARCKNKKNTENMNNIESYFGLLQYCKSYKLRRKMCYYLFNNL